MNFKELYKEIISKKFPLRHFFLPPLSTNCFPSKMVEYFFGIGSIIPIGQEIKCLPSAGLVLGLP